jgi:hypothetical protein
MKPTTAGLLRALATRTVIAVIPVAMVSAYASGIFVSPPRMASYDYTQVAEIVDSSTTIGMAESPLYGMSQADINATLDQMQSIGVQNIRVFVPWALIQQSPTTYDWSELDKVMAAAAARNMGVMAEVNATPTWAGPNPGNPGFPPGSDTPNVAAFTNFMQAFMAHTVNGASYASIVSAYEIWNEPNYIQFSNPISPEAYATLLAAVYPVIKAVDPTSTVVAGAVGATQNSPFTMDPVTFVQRMLAALGPNALNYFDALSIHPYSDQIPFSGSCPTCTPGVLTPRQQVEAIMAMIGTKKVWLSEYGVPSTDPASYQQQATWIKDLLDTWQNYQQAGPVFIYTARDQAGSTDSGANLGVWTSSGGEKVYVVNGVSYTVSQLIAQWIAAHPLPTNPTNPGIPVLNPVLALVQSLVAGVQAFVTAVVTAITNFLGGLASSLSGVAASAAPLSLRSASAASSDTVSLAAESDVAAGTEEAKAGDGKDAGAVAAEAAAEATATEKTASAEVPAEVTKTPVEPVVATEPTVPAATVPAATVPAATVPAATETTTGTTTETKTETTGTKSGTTTGTSSGSTTSIGSSTESSGSPSESKSGGSGRSGDAGKSGGSDGQSKSDKDGKEGKDKDGQGRHARANGGASQEAAKADAPKAKAEGASESSSGVAG